MLNTNLHSIAVVLIINIVIVLLHVITLCTLDRGLVILHPL